MVGFRCRHPNSEHQREDHREHAHERLFIAARDWRKHWRTPNAAAPQTA
jgi:hypothetical protein